MAAEEETLRITCRPMNAKLDALKWMDLWAAFWVVKVIYHVPYPTCQICWTCCLLFKWSRSCFSCWEMQRLNEPGIFILSLYANARVQSVLFLGCIRSLWKDIKMLWEFGFPPINQTISTNNVNFFFSYKSESSRIFTVISVRTLRLHPHSVHRPGLEALNDCC